jgi:ABC-2 type transport system ATP-binding protein
MTTIPSQPAIRATGLRKSYGDTLALDGVDLEVAEGTIFALLGPNGAGKTTAVQILSSLISPDGGEVRVAGHDLAREPDTIREVIGVTGQFSAVDKLLTGEENLLLMADLYHLDRREGRRRARRASRRTDPRYVPAAHPWSAWTAPLPLSRRSVPRSPGGTFISDRPAGS